MSYLYSSYVISYINQNSVKSGVFFLRFIYLCVWKFCVHARMYTMCIPIGYLGTGVARDCEVLCVCVEN